MRATKERRKIGWRKFSLTKIWRKPWTSHLSSSTNQDQQVEVAYLQLSVKLWIKWYHYQYRRYPIHSDRDFKTRRIDFQNQSPILYGLPAHIFILFSWLFYYYDKAYIKFSLYLDIFAFKINEWKQIRVDFSYMFHDDLLFTHLQ